ncbi:RdgB/HAM1 family non-canonical purine NTP pyrophosphatase [Melioribacter sp. Ez-97]|uniref:RdgB/HAM1 family non-canonical purine NTP pyrophosphatase n=1 Tax=Melioribacter sp. Ez-97 TaxID=3423434 RepID=UPI003ED8D197
MKIIFATQNQGKNKEVKNILNGNSLEVYSLYDLGNNIEIEETGNTFKENAFLKAKTIYDVYKVPVIADDSGLEIEQLDGRPGVFSARYAGENCTFDDNNKKVLKELEDKPEPHNARFVCHAVFYDGDNLLEAVGYLKGVITKTPAGEHGFGYDPIFIPEGYDKTLAELELEEKNKISHRSMAFKELKEKILKLKG